MRWKAPRADERPGQHAENISAAKEKRRHHSVSPQRGCDRGVIDPSRRAVLEEQGRGRLVDSQGPLRAGRGCARQFKEETGSAPDGAFVYLGEFRLPSGKRLAVWAVEGDLDLATFGSETFRMEWPPRSWRFADFPEADRAAWFPPGDAMRRITKGQRPILEALFTTLGYAPDYKGHG